MKQAQLVKHLQRLTGTGRKSRGGLETVSQMKVRLVEAMQGEAAAHSPAPDEEEVRKCLVDVVLQVQNSVLIEHAKSLESPAAALPVPHEVVAASLTSSAGSSARKLITTGRWACSTNLRNAEARASGLPKPLHPTKQLSTSWCWHW